jgi:uncharacterized Fe-S center protein
MAKVYFTDLRTTPSRSLFSKIETLLDRSQIAKRIQKNDLVAIKLHFGEKGNTAYLRPVFLRVVVDKVKALGAKPFLTDSNTLYVGSRSNAVSHLTTAIENGFDYSCVGCPVVIAGGLRGQAGTKVLIPGEVLKEVHVAQEIVEADALIAVTHFKGHELSGFGGALKNLGMGCATRAGKLEQHSTVAPKINQKTCKGCRLCMEYCPANAIIYAGKKIVEIDKEKCIGCGECVVVCPSKAVDIQWNEDQCRFQQKIVEYAAGALKGKEKKSLFLNFVMQVSPTCDCYPNNDAAIVRDIGILGSADPVAIDAASNDLVLAEEGLPNTALKKVLGKGQDKWLALYPTIDWNIQLDHGEKLKLGERAYTLVKV